MEEAAVSASLCVWASLTIRTCTSSAPSACRILGWEQRFCTRCSGQWFGTVVCVAASLVARLEITLVVWSVAVALLPLPALIDWVTQTWGIRESGTLLRLVTGGLLGIGIGLEIVSAVQLEWGRLLVGFVVFCSLCWGNLHVVQD